MFKFIEIGTFNVGKSNPKGYLIQLNEGFEKACTKLHLFSHCIVFTYTNKRIQCQCCHIIKVDEKKGELIVESPFDKKMEFSGILVDIKPYFPGEELIENCADTDHRYLIDFRGEAIGKYILIGGKQAIKLNEKFDISAVEISEGDYIRVLWWFHRFDKKEFRRNRMVQPPYDDAPKTGIFATRSPMRPNPIASTIVKVKTVDKVNGIIGICGFDGFENSMILELMSYQPLVDRIRDVVVPQWVRHWSDHKSYDEPRDIEDNKVNPNMNFDEKTIDDLCFYDELEKNIKVDEDINYDEITIKNANIHNLKNISLTIPKEKITVITGVSGSGKSSLAFDTIYEESRKQFMDLVSSSGGLNSDINDTKVEKITGLQPAIAIEQRNLGLNPRSTVGTVSKIGTYIKLLFSTLGERVCPNCHNVIGESNVCGKCSKVLFKMHPQMFSYNHPDYMCPVCKGLGIEMQIDPELIVENPEVSILDNASAWWGNLRKHREKPNANWMRGEVLALADEMDVDLEVSFNELSEEFRHEIFYGSNGREVTLEYKNSKGRSGKITRPVEGVVNIINRLLSDSKSDRALDYAQRYMVKKICSRCHGERLLEEGRLVNIKGYRYPQVMNLSMTNLHKWCHFIYDGLTDDEREKTKGIFTKIIYHLNKIENVGLGYISMGRSIPNLSGGEAQRLKIATQFGSGLTNILYIMDEPSKGLHPKDYRFLLETINELKKSNNTVVMVEHKESFLSIADIHITIGPKAGQYGGEITGIINLEDEREQMENTFGERDALNKYDQFYKEVTIKSGELVGDIKKLIIKGVRTNNLKDIEVVFPLNKLISIIGVSGSGKSSLVSKTLYPALMKKFGRNVEESGDFENLQGCEYLKDVYLVSQKSIGKNSRSNPGTYTGVLDLIRDYYAKTPEGKRAKLTKEYFSFNSKKGQCPHCKGLGQVAVPMHYMEDIYVTCSYCNGQRYKGNVLEVKPLGYSINDLLEMEIGELKEVFEKEAQIYKILDMLDKVGLSYIKLGQSAATLSGGEAQRIKLAKELSKGEGKDVLYILDEPTSGLHEDDVEKLVKVLKELVDKGATVIVIEHNSTLIDQSDWIIEMGPEGGDLGGQVVRYGR